MATGKTKKRLLAEAYEMMLDLKEGGLIDAAAMEEFEALYVSETGSPSVTNLD